MPIVYLFIILLAIGMGLYRLIKKKKLPSNSYTPYDNITMGKNTDVKKINPIEDTKHRIEYEDRIDHK